jgi:hypothetical protein
MMPPGDPRDKNSTKRKAENDAMLAAAMSPSPPGTVRMPDYDSGPVLYLGGNTPDVYLATPVDAPVHGYMSFSSDRDTYDDEGPFSNVMLVDLMIHFVLYPDDSVGISRIMIYAYRNEESPLDVDLLNLYGPWCLLRKHGIHASNLMLESTWNFVDVVDDDVECPEKENCCVVEPRCAVIEPRIAEIFDKIDALLTLAESRASTT